MRDIVGYENIYGITSCGRVWSYRNKRFLKPACEKNGYMRIMLCKDGQNKMYSLHRIVAEAYIPNPDNLPEVDHIDNDKNHNYVNNLQWITHRDNWRKSKNKPILQFDLDGNFIREWPCANDIGREARVNIGYCLKGKYKTAYNYIWKYKEAEV